MPGAPDVRVVRFIGRLLRLPVYLLLEPEDWYKPVRSFLLTVGGGLVSRRRAAARQHFCDHSGPGGRQCPSRRSTDGIHFCTGPDAGCGGRCPKARWWPFGWLSFRRRLRRWGCPKGYWQTDWTWLDATRRGTLRALANFTRRLAPNWRSQRRAAHAKHVGRQCQRAELRLGRHPFEGRARAAS